VPHRNAPLTETGRLRLAAASSKTAGHCAGPRNASKSPSPPPHAGPTATASTARPGWPTGPAAHTTAHAKLRPGASDASSRSGSCAAGDPPASATSSTSHPRRCIASWPATAWPDWRTWTGPPRYRCAATNTPPPGTWCTSTSRSWATSPTAAATAPWAAPPADATAATADTATPTCTRRGRPLPTGLHRDPPRRTPRHRRRVLDRAQAFFADAGITVARVLTDNGACYRSHPGATPGQRRDRAQANRPYRLRPYGKVERFNRTLLEEWAYAHPYRSETERRAALQGWLPHLQSPPRTYRAWRSPTRSPRPKPLGQYT
jgi:hypothetical protein